MRWQNTLFFFICLTALSKVLSADARFARSIKTVPLKATMKVRNKNRSGNTEPAQEGGIFQDFLCCDSAMFRKCLTWLMDFVRVNRCYPSQHEHIHFTTESMSIARKGMPLMVADKHRGSVRTQDLFALNVPFPIDQRGGEERERPGGGPLRQSRSSGNTKKY